MLPFFITTAGLSGSFHSPPHLGGRRWGRAGPTGTGKLLPRRRQCRISWPSSNTRRRPPSRMASERPAVYGSATTPDGDVSSFHFVARFRSAAWQVHQLSVKMAESDAVMVDDVEEDIDWETYFRLVSGLSESLDYWIGDVESQIKSFPPLFSDRPDAISDGFRACEALLAQLEQVSLARLGEAVARADAALRRAISFRSPAAAREHLSEVATLYKKVGLRLRGLVPTLLEALDGLRRLFDKECPVKSLLKPPQRLSGNRQGSPGSTLALVPARDEAVRIRQDSNIVRLLTYLAVTRGEMRGMSFIASSPGLGKSHLVWDVLEALSAVDVARFATAADRAGHLAWPDVVRSLHGVRVCVITFNSASKWSGADRELIDECSSHAAGALLPLYLRVMWYLRCSHTLPWEALLRLVVELLAGGRTTVDAIITEALLALRERPTIVNVEEISEVTGTAATPPTASPTEKLWKMLQSTQGAEDGAVPVKPVKRTRSLFYNFRHEICTWTCMVGADLSVLFTAPSLGGVMFQDVKNDLTKEQVDVVASLADKLSAAGLRDKVEGTTIVSSMTNTLVGSPFYVLCALELSFLDVDDIANAYFLPLFKSRFSIMASLPAKSTRELPADVSARALASLSGCHVRGAAFILMQLKKAATSKLVWTEVVIPAADALFGSPDGSVTPVLDGMLTTTPIAIVAAVYPCEIDCRQPFYSNSMATRPCASWNALVSSNALTVAVPSSTGVIKNPSMPPLYLLALLSQWEERKRETVVRQDIKEFIRHLGGVLDALHHVLDACAGKGSAPRVWEYVAMYADVALTRVRAAAIEWGAASPGVRLPHDYTAVTLRVLYTGTLTYYAKDVGRPLLESTPFNATRSVHVRTDEAAITMPSILGETAEVLVSTVFKCRPSEYGFDSIKFLSPGGGSTSPEKQELVAVCKSAKFTGHAQS